MTSFILDVFVRSLLIAAGTALVLRTFRIKTAAVRHAAWTAVVVSMLALPVWSFGGWKVALPVLPATAPSSDSATVGNAQQRDIVQGSGTQGDRAGVTSIAPSPSPLRVSARAASWADALLGVYLAGVFLLLARLIIGTVHALRLRHTIAVVHGRATSARIATPITVGWLAPILILPTGWTHWPAAQLDAVLTHEQEHARRRDPLVQWVALFNRAIFWCHPLAWWLERRLATLAEEACDTAVLQAGHSPQDYSQYLLDMARSLARAGRRVNVVGMAMPGSGLTQRIRSIYEGLPMVPISRVRLATSVVLCAMSSMTFAAGSPVPRRAEAQNAKADRFEVVSIKPCDVTVPPAGGRGLSPFSVQLTPGSAHWDCVSLKVLIMEAYVGDGSRLLNNVTMQQPDDLKVIRGGPDWAESEKFTIEATGPVVPLFGNGYQGKLSPETQLQIRAMLEDRFQLKLRRVAEERPLYALSVAPGGLKLGAAAPSKCWQRSATQKTPPPGYEGLRACGYNTNGRMDRGNQSISYTGASLASLAQHLSMLMDRNVIDNTGVDGRFDFTLVFAEDDHTPKIAVDRAREEAAFARFATAPSVPSTRPPADVPNIFKAFELLGLKLEPVKGPQEFLVIDSVQRPKPNAPAADALQPPPRAQGTGKR